MSISREWVPLRVHTHVRLPSRAAVDTPIFVCRDAWFGHGHRYLNTLVDNIALRTTPRTFPLSTLNRLQLGCVALSWQRNKLCNSPDSHGTIVNDLHLLTISSDQYHVNISPRGFYIKRRFTMVEKYGSARRGYRVPADT